MIIVTGEIEILKVENKCKVENAKGAKINARLQMQKVQKQMQGLKQMQKGVNQCKVKIKRPKRKHKTL